MTETSTLYDFPYSGEFAAEMHKYYLKAAKTEGRPNTERWVNELLAREAHTMRSREKMPLAILARHHVLPNASILESGCGTGRNVVLFAKAGGSVTGIDLDLEALAVARARCREDQVTVELFPANVLHLPFTSSSFDIVLCQNMLEHIAGEMHGHAVQEMVRVLRPGGILFIQAPNKLSPIDIHTSRLPFIHWLPRSLNRLVSHLGIPAPHEDLPSYDDILKAARLESPVQVLNRCDVWKDLTDYRRYSVCYSSSFELPARLYFRLIPAAFAASRIFRMELNKWLPVLNLFLRKL